tara:strand:+ start:2993 stop:4444 length:1452 start_codon:yes stop_codon:yes gene_type:complete
MTPEEKQQALYDLNPFLVGYSSNNISNIPDVSPRQTGQRIDTGRGSYYHVNADGDIDRSQEHFVSAKDIPFDQPGWVTSFYGWNENPEQIWSNINKWTTEQNPNEKNRENFNTDIRAYASQSGEASMREQQQLLNTFLDTGKVPDDLRSGFAIDALDYAFREMGRDQQRKSPGLISNFVNAFNPVRMLQTGWEQEAVRVAGEGIRGGRDYKYDESYWELDGEQIVAPTQGQNVERNETEAERLFREIFERSQDYQTALNLFRSLYPQYSEMTPSAPTTSPGQTNTGTEAETGTEARTSTETDNRKDAAKDIIKMGLLNEALKPSKTPQNNGIFPTFEDPTLPTRRTGFGAISPLSNNALAPSTTAVLNNPFVNPVIPRQQARVNLPLNNRMYKENPFKKAFRGVKNFFNKPYNPSVKSPRKASGLSMLEREYDFAPEFRGSGLRPITEFGTRTKPSISPLTRGDRNPFKSYNDRMLQEFVRTL